MLEFAALIVGIVTTSLIALAVFAKNRQSITNKLFLVFASSLIGWSLTTYFSLHTSNDAQTLYWIRWIMFFVVSQNISFFLLVQVFPDHRSNLIYRRRYQLALAYSALTAVVAISPFLFATFTNGTPQPGPGMALFVPHALIFAIGGIIALIIKYRHARGLKRTQLRYFLAGTLLLFTVEPLGNFIMPLVFKNDALVTYSPLYAIVFSGLIAYAIVTKKLFDIRAAVARSVGYILIVGTMVVTYGVLLFGVVDVLFRGQSHEFLRQVASIVLVTPLALSFQGIKRFFDRVTRRLFYKDSYDAQDVLDRLAHGTASEIELYKILESTRQVLTDALKSSYIEFVLIKNDKPYLEAYTKKIISQDMLALGSLILEQEKQLLILEELPPQSRLREGLSRVGASLSLQLATHKQVVGYIVFGEKRSGEIYSTQDKKLLSIVANELAVAVQNALRFEEIQNFNLTLQAKVQEATKKLQHVNQRLKTLDETKDDFISMASHQLRTPLTSVKGYLSMVIEGDAGKINATQQKMLGQAFVSSQRMVYLIADLLNVSRLRTGKFVIEAVPTDLSVMIQEEIAQLVETAGARDIELTYDKPEDFPLLNLDETKTRQVIMNFVDNAIYYTPANGHIRVELTATERAAELRVIDDGIGVPMAERHHLFTKFYRAGNARKARPDGTGLGLYMAKKVILAEGGSIIFDSRDGQGSTFGFSFPLRKLQVTTKPVIPPKIPVAKPIKKPTKRAIAGHV